MPTSSAWTSPRSRLGMACNTLRCLCDLPALTWGGRKPRRDSSEEPVLPIGHDEVDLGGSSLARDLQQRLSHFSHLMGACPSHEHVGQPFGNMGFRAHGTLGECSRVMMEGSLGQVYWEGAETRRRGTVNLQAHSGREPAREMRSQSSATTIDNRREAMG